MKSQIRVPISQVHLTLRGTLMIPKSRQFSLCISFAIVPLVSAKVIWVKERPWGTHKRTENERRLDVVCCARASNKIHLIYVTPPASPSDHASTIAIHLGCCWSGE